MKKYFRVSDIVLLIIILLFDQFTKYYMFANLDKPVPLIEGFLYLTKVTNTGAAWEFCLTI